MKNSIRTLMTLSIVLLVSCGTADSEGTGSTGTSKDQDLQVRDVILEKKGDNKLRIRWTAPVEAERVDYYLVELRSADTEITRRVSAGETELEIAVPGGSYQTSVAVVAEGVVEPGVSGGQEQSVATEATVPGDVEMTAVDLRTTITSAEHASIEVNWRAPPEAGKEHGGGAAEPEAYILYWKKGTAVGTNDYEGTATVKKEASTGVLATNAVIEAVIPDSSYAVRVVAENTAGLRSGGVEQTIKTAASQAAAPSEPVIQTSSIESVGTASAATLSFSWATPVSLGTDYKGNPAEIKEYRIYWEEGGSVSVATGELLILSKDTNRASIPELKNETEYTFMVEVQTIGGLSTRSAAESYTTAATTLAEAPEAVSNFSATASENELEITLQWDAHTGAMNGKKANGETSLFKAYHLYWVEGETAVFIGNASMQITVQATATHSIAKEFLKGGTDYTVSIVVENSEGLRSKASIQQVQTKDFAAPPASITPTLTATVIGNTEAEIAVSWAAPDDTGKTSSNEEAQIDKYILTWKEGTTIPSGEGTTQELSADAELSLTLDALEPGKTYTVAVVAVNTAGQEGTAVEVMESIPASQESDPAAPVLEDTSIETQSTSTDAYITVSWLKPAAGKRADGSEAIIDGYVLYWKENSAIVSLDDYTGKQDIEGTETSISIQGLTVSTQYALLLVLRSSNGREAQSNVAVKSTGAATTAEAPGVVTALAAMQVMQDTERRTALRLSWTEPSSFGKTEAGGASTLGEYKIYLQKSSEPGSVDVSGPGAYTTTNTEYTIPAEDLDGGTTYRLAVVVVNSEGTRSEAAEVEGTPYDLSEAPPAVDNIDVDLSHKELSEIKIHWAPVSGKDKNGNAAGAKYQIYKGESSNGYVDALDLIAKVASPDAIVDSTTETVEGAERVVYTMEGLSANIEYDIVVRAVHSENSELVSTPVLKGNVLSNGVSRLALYRGDVELTNGANLDLEVGNEIALRAEMEFHNVATGIRWVSMDVGIATVAARSAEPGTADITALSVGEAKLRATSEADATKTVEVTIRVNKVDISGSTLSYASNMNVRKGESKTIGIYSKTIPEEANVEYALSPAITGIEIDSGTGIITAGASLEEETYTFTVEATVAASDATYTGKVSSNQISLEVMESNIIYKPISVGSRSIFTASDADNPWLFVVGNLDSATEISATIIITERGVSTVLYEQRDIVANSFEHEGETVVGFGPSLSASSGWAAITAEELSIAVLVYKNSEEIDSRTLNVDKGIAGGIYSWRDLQEMGEDLTGDYVMQNDIVFPAVGTYGFPATGFAPIGKDTTSGNEGHQGTAFSGSLDGGGHSIKGLVVSDAELDYGGLFGMIDANASATEVVKDLVMEDPHINVNAMAGAVVGYLRRGTIVRVAAHSTAETSGVWTDGSVLESDGRSEERGYTGGLVGMLNLGKILQCASEVSVTGAHQSVGGLVGYVGSSSTVTGYATGAVSGLSQVGGLVGYNYSGNTITGYAQGTVSGSNYVGGLEGYNYSGNTTTGYARGMVSGGSYVGGLGGYSSSSSTVTGYVRGTVKRNGGGSSVKFGLLVGSGVGKGYYSLAESSFIGVDKDGTTGASGKPLPMKEETTKEAFDLLDFIDGPWRWIADGQWPAIDIGVIKSIDEQPTERSDSEFPEDTCFTAENNNPVYSEGFYQISNWQELQWMENCLNANYKLAGDIAMPEPGQGGMPQTGFTPVGNLQNPFTGHFDGDGYSISGLSIDQSMNYVGLFGVVYGGRVANLHIEHNGIKGDDYVGAVAGYIMFTRTEGISIESTEKVSGGSYVGGQVGYSDGSTVTGVMRGSVFGTGKQVGGLVGGAYTQTTTIGYMAGNVSGVYEVGGLVGRNSISTIAGYVSGNVSGTGGYHVGGLMGYGGGKVIGYVTGDVSGSNNVGGLGGNFYYGKGIGYATGAISGINNVNGLAGIAHSSSVFGYWDQGTTNAGDVGIGISSTENIYYYTSESETSGREQHKYYDKGTGFDSSNPDAEDDEIFNDENFASVFEFPEKDMLWPRLKQSFTFNDESIVLSDVIYKAQKDAVGWGDAE